VGLIDTDRFRMKHLVASHKYKTVPIPDEIGACITALEKKTNPNFQCE